MLIDRPDDTPPFGTLDEVQEWERSWVWWHHAQGRRSVVLEAATGTGKTHLSVGLIGQGTERFRRPALFLAHRKELIEQAEEEFLGQGLDVLVEMGNRRAHKKLEAGLFGGPDVIVASHLSLHADRITKYGRDFFGLALTDECHLSDPESYRHIYRYFNLPLHVGLSATPFRMDGAAVYGDSGSVFEVRACRYSIRDAIKRGHLVPIKSREMGIGIDLSQCRLTGKKAKDFDPADLERRVLAKLGPVVNGIFKEFKKYGFKKVLVFAPDVSVCHKIAGALRGEDFGLKAFAVHGDNPRHPMSDEERAALIKGYKTGDIEVLVSCELLTTGFNHPPTEAIFMAVATTSLVKFAQSVGRVTRLSPATGKEFGYVFGFTWTGAEGLMSTVDLFLDFDSPKVKERAEAILAGNPNKTVDEAVEEAEAIQEVEDQRDLENELAASLLHDAEMRKAAIRKKDMKYRVNERTPFGVGADLGLDLVGMGGVEPATPAHVAFLRERGIEGAAGLSRVQARALIDQVTIQEMMGRATLAQADAIAKNRIMSREEALKLGKTEARDLLLRRWKKYGSNRKSKGA